jgi:hypothetical protein
MTDQRPGDQEAESVDDRMAAELERRRQQRPDRRRAARSVSSDRRRVCGYCYQSGDHRTVQQCLRALERRERILNAED